MQKLKESWVVIETSEANQVDLPRFKNLKDKVIKVFDYEGWELNHNAEARAVLFI